MGLLSLLIPDRWRRLRVSSKILSAFARFTLKVLTVRPTAIGTENFKGLSHALLVGNHMSYVDVIVLVSFYPTCFVTSTEVRDAPGLGLICRMSGCLFVDRRNRMKIRNDVSEIGEALSHNLSVAIFPEATSGNGEQMLRFKKPLYLSALETGSPILPFCLNYRRVGGEPINRVSRDKICWYGDMDFIPHLWALLGSGGVDAEINFLPPIFPAAGEDATAIVERSQAAVESVFAPIK